MLPEQFPIHLNCAETDIHLATNIFCNILEMIVYKHRLLLQLYYNYLMFLYDNGIYMYNGGEIILHGSELHCMNKPC